MLPTPDGGGCYRPPRATDHHARPPLLLLPPPRGRTNADPPPSLSRPAPPSHFFQTHAGRRPVPILPSPSLPRPSHRSRALPSRTNLPVALPSTGAPAAVSIWPPPPLSSLSSVRCPPSLPSPNPRPSLTSLSPSNLQGALLIVGGHRRPPVSSKHRRAEALPPPRRRQPGLVGFPSSLGRPAHSSCNTTALGVGPVAPRAPAHRR
jgi:hypothetical protein